MLRRLLALSCLALLLAALAASLVHDHQAVHDTTDQADGCLACASALPVEDTRLPGASERVFAVALASPGDAPVLRSVLDPAHSGNAPPV